MNPAELGPALEERGFESVWLAEHSHIPASRKSPWPGGDELPQMYYDTLDPFVTLGAMAATTSTLKLCTGITLVVQRDPIHTAKEVASLDVLSGGRVLFGVGAGWNKEEMSDHGTDPESRFGLMRERIEAMKALWAADPAEY
ncbi:MAG TPA: LLM class F420-dependent oxidoreductase, partial [Acidimicrobiaceae bacterium]|nr:LLM class F420-dependent oxidoreductase [Acidimicrobiaceae bacterium]